MDDILCEALIWRLVVQTCNCGTQGLKARDHEPHCEISQAITSHVRYVEDADRWREHRTSERNKRRFGNLPTMPPASGGLSPSEVQSIVSATLAQFAEMNGIKLAKPPGQFTAIPTTAPGVIASAPSGPPGDQELLNSVATLVPQPTTATPAAVAVGNSTANSVKGKVK